MITYVKESKLDKLNPSLYKIVSLSSKVDASFVMTELAPPADLLGQLHTNQISKKKFLKKYKKYISKENTVAELMIYNIVRSLNNNANICFVVPDIEFRDGYAEVLANYIAEEYGFTAYNVKDSSDTIKTTTEDLDKKERKLLKTTENLSDKKIKKKAKIIKNVLKSMNGNQSAEEDKIDALNDKFAIHNMVSYLTDEGAILFNDKQKFSGVDASKACKMKKIVEAIKTTYNSDKFFKGIIKKILYSHDLKIKDIKDLESDVILALLVEINQAICNTLTGTVSD